MVDVSKPFSDEMEKLPKDSTEESRAEQKEVGMVGAGGCFRISVRPHKVLGYGNWQGKWKSKMWGQ